MTSFFIKHKNTSFFLAIILVALSSFCLFFLGLKTESDLAEMFYLFEKELLLLVSVFALMFLYALLSFRRIIRPVSSWHYGLLCLVLFLYDLVLCLGIFSVLGIFYNFKISLFVIPGLIIISGYSFNNKLIFFNRIRENLLKRDEITFEQTVVKSSRQALSCQVNILLISLFATFAVFFLSNETTKSFALSLIVAIVVGSYSSLFLTGPLLVYWIERTRV